MSETRIIANDPQWDGADLWVCDVRQGDAYPVGISTADRITVVPGRDNLFAVVHHYYGEQVVISAHSMDEPTYVLSHINIRGTSYRFTGNEEVWRKLPRAFVAYYTADRLSDADHHLILVNSVDRTVMIRKFPSFYEGGMELKDRVSGMIEVPRQSAVLIEEGRDERPLLLFNTRKHKVNQRLNLKMKPDTNRCYRFREHAQELWVSDPDRLVKLTPNLLGDWSIKANVRLQLMDTTGGRFTGEFTFNADESLCIAARPYIGDALLIDTHKFEIMNKVYLEARVKSILLLNDGRVVARDWFTGKLVQSHVHAHHIMAAVG
ncbi:MAG: hypothetical protein ACR2IE_14750 [Candidatus Sumerlaeaceae bacterium]